MKKWAFPLAALLSFAPPVWAQQDELAKLRAEVAAQQAAMTRLLARIDALEKKLSETATKEELEDEARTQQDSVNSVRESISRRVNISGYSNFRYVHEEPGIPSAFQLDHLGLIFGKQLGRFNFLAELELQNVPHHAEAVGVEEEGHVEEGAAAESAEERAAETDISGEGQVAVENAWMEYNHNRYLSVRVGKQLSPQYWWQHRYPNLTYSTTLPIYLRELFPPELTGVMVHGQVARPAGASEFGVGYSLYASNNNFEGNSQSDLRSGKSWGGRVQVRFPVSGVLRRLDVAADIYRGRTALELQGNELVDDNVEGFEGQLEISRFLLNGEYARGESEGVKRKGFYLQPAIQLHPDWVSFYRVEQLESPRLQRAERRHLLGLNYRPFAQVALKGEWYRSMPLERSFIEHEEERRSFNGFAAAAVFFF